tara:strand:+ start:558 stop:1604 length:1047 start_codon:yes stop_codon:yes gene_type:complete
MQQLDIIHMRRCFELAKQGQYTASPNPMVGCVVVRNNEIIAEGYHRKKGEAHAERDALLKIDNAKGATLYCNLEPCCHTKKTTPPCVPLIIEKQISRVVLSNIDPNPQVSGQGIKLLRDAGIMVNVGILEQEGSELNKAFFHSMKYSRPYITLKFAQTLDGKMATLRGDSKWITSDKSRARAHKLRVENDAVLVGGRTLNLDNPKLTPRFGHEELGKCPYRIVIGNPDKMDKSANLFNDEYRDRSIILSTNDRAAFDPSIKRMEIGSTVDWQKVWSMLHDLEIRSLLIEGGPQVLSSIIEQNAFDAVEVFIAPRILGDGIAISGRAQELMKNTIQLSGEDIHLSARRN